MNIKITEVSIDDKWAPNCPHCGKQIREIYVVSKGIIDQHKVYVCSKCSAVISIGHNFGW
jgi:predicted RNA-binding Zn-ribbon protein involved in translation (DUF1610 family)